MDRVHVFDCHIVVVENNFHTCQAQIKVMTNMQEKGKKHN